MMLMNTTPRSMAATTVAVMAFCAASSAQPMFTGMGKVPPGYAGITDVASVYGITNTGIVYGHGDFSPMTWTLISGYKILQTLGQASFGNVYGCTADETLFFGRSFDDPVTRAVPVVWSDLNTVPDEIPGLPAGWSSLEFSVNANGSIIVGNAEPIIPGPLSIFIWRDGPTAMKHKMQVITAFPAGKELVALYDINDKGDFAVGGSASVVGNIFEAASWSQTNGFEFYGDLPGGPFSSAFEQVDATGRVIAGNGWDAVKPRAVRWTPYHAMTDIEQPNPLWLGSFAPAMDQAGSMIGGVVGVAQQPSGVAMLWNPRDGIRTVKEILVSEYGLTEVAAWNLWAVIAISPNGRFLAGTGINPQGANETWFAQITPFCYADCNGDKVLNIFDYICFGSEFSQQTIYANCDNDGQMNIFDYICFGNHFAAGCEQ